MENNNNLMKTPIGTKENQKLKPAKVKVLGVEIRTVGEKGSNKVVCLAQHPLKNENIEISAVKYENKKSKKMEVGGLWVNLDDEKKIRKGSALATLLTFYGCADIDALRDRELETVENDEGYLCFKAY